MFITTNATFDIETGACLEREGYEYTGPLALCDRSAHSTAQQAGQSAAAGAGVYGSNAAAIGGPLVGYYTGEATNPQGFGAAKAGMMGEAGAMAAANSGQAAQSSRMRAMRTGNAAGQGAVDTAAAQAGGQNETGAVQGILTQNAQLENAQRQAGLQGLQGLYGTNVNAQLGMLGAQTGAANAMTNANSQGWLQNALGVAKAGSQGVAAAYGAGGIPGMPG